jgi:predicted short-subunit dehydrogenase-like oxidoreductase (DUF2520 family)
VRRSPRSAQRPALRIGFAGAGRLAGALAPALARAGYEVAAVASRRLEPAQALAVCIPGCRAVASVQEVAEASDLVFLAVPDDRISAVAGAIRWRADMAAVHCSGAAGLEALVPAVQQGAAAGGFHPLQTFSGGEAPLAGVTIAVEASGGLLETLDAMARALGCCPIHLPSGAKPLYHASAAFASNYVVTLLAQAARLWRPLGFSEADALAALLPLVKTAVANVERNGTRQALTGPIARGDSGTVERHLRALQANAPDLIDLYRELGRQTLPHTGLTAGRRAELASILGLQEKQPCA